MECIEGKEEIVMENREISETPRKPNGIVRCKKCRYLRPRNGCEDRYVCTRWNNTTGLNEFCSYGVEVEPFIIE